MDSPKKVWIVRHEDDPIKGGDFRIARNFVHAKHLSMLEGGVTYWCLGRKQKWGGYWCPVTGMIIEQLDAKEAMAKKSKNGRHE